MKPFLIAQLVIAAGTAVALTSPVLAQTEAEEGSAAKRFFFILLGKQKNISNKSHYIQYRCMMQEKNQSPRPLSGHTASELFFLQTDLVAYCNMLRR